jgi:hypothetical protein
MECEYLKRWFGTLTEHNRRLQKEVEELRAMKVGPPTVLLSPHSCEPLPASTLSMCPRCERVTTNTADKFVTDAVTLSPKVSAPVLHSRQIWNALVQSLFLHHTHRALYITNWLCKTDKKKIVRLMSMFYTTPWVQIIDRLNLFFSNCYEYRMILMVRFETVRVVKIFRYDASQWG